MEREIVITITEELVGMRLDRAIALSHSEISRSKASQLILSGEITSRGTKLKPSHITKLGEVFSLRFSTEVESQLEPYNIELDIAFEDEHIMVVNKPSGLVVHPAAGHAGDTLVNALIAHSKNLSLGSSHNRPGLVHRIDKDTSGLLVIAKNDHAHMELSKQFQNKTVHRVYKAVTFGPMKDSILRFETKLNRHPKNRKKFSSQKSGRVAITNVELQKSNPLGFHLVHCILETGRTHQIRIHLSENKTPILADPIYGNYQIGGPKYKTQIQNIFSMTPHLMLHAAELGFIHPSTQKVVLFKTPWPQETHAVLKTLGFLE